MTTPPPFPVSERAPAPEDAPAFPGGRRRRGARRGSRPRRGLVALAVVVLVAGLSVAGTLQARAWMEERARPVGTIPAPRTSWRYELHLVVPLRVDGRPGALAALVLFEDSVRPTLARVGARVDADAAGAREFTVVVLTDDDRQATVVLAEAGRSLPAGTTVATFAWRAGGPAGAPLRVVELADVRPSTG